MKQTVEFAAIETHVKCHVWDPFPRAEDTREDGLDRDAIVEKYVEQYKPWPGMLIAITIYEVSVAKINGITYKSEPLNKQTWTKTL